MDSDKQVVNKELSISMGGQFRVYRRLQLHLLVQTLDCRACVWRWGSGVLHRNVQRLQGGLVVKAHRLLYHSTRREGNKEEEGWAPDSYRVRAWAITDPSRVCTRYD